MPGTIRPPRWPFSSTAMRPSRARESSPRRSTCRRFPGIDTGGTLHIVANNQVGFTTDPEEGRSTRYSSDLAKGFDSPIVHVNADDPEAAIAAIRLAMAFRVSLPPRRRRRPRRLPALRPQRAGRAGVHAAAHGRAHRERTPRFVSSTRRSSPRRASSIRPRTNAIVHEVERLLKEAHERLKSSFGKRPARRRAEPRPSAPWRAGHRRARGCFSAG